MVARRIEQFELHFGLFQYKSRQLVSIERYPYGSLLLLYTILGLQ